MKTIQQLQREFYSAVNQGLNRQAQTFNQTGEATVVIPSGFTVAESIVTVVFTNPMMERPCFTFGAALDDGQFVTNGSFPTVSAIVASWHKVNDPSHIVAGNGTAVEIAKATAWLGAKIAVVVTGVEHQRIIIHYSFLANALVFSGAPSPTNNTGTA